MSTSSPAAHNKKGYGEPISKPKKSSRRNRYVRTMIARQGRRYGEENGATEQAELHCWAP